MLYLFLLNGPPKSGKSTLAREAVRLFQRKQINAVSEGFAAPLRAFAASLHGLPYTSIAKDEKLPLLNNESTRDLLIGLSESYLRERYGRDFFSRCLLARWTRAVRAVAPTVLVMEDSGFEEEIAILPREQVCLVRIVRPRFTYTNDSRSDLSKPDNTLFNDGTLENALHKTADVVQYAIDKWRLRK